MWLLFLLHVSMPPQFQLNQWLGKCVDGVAAFIVDAKSLTMFPKEKRVYSDIIANFEPHLHCSRWWALALAKLEWVVGGALDLTRIDSHSPSSTIDGINPEQTWAASPQSEWLPVTFLG